MNKKIAWLLVTVSIFIGGVIYTNHTEHKTPTAPTKIEAKTETPTPKKTATKAATKKTASTAKVKKTVVTTTYQKHEVLDDGTTRSYPMQEKSVEVPQEESVITKFLKEDK